MALHMFGNSAKEISNVKHFEIRLEASNLVLRGTPDEASSAVLKGTLVLCLSEPLKIQGIRLRFTGEKRLGFTIHILDSGRQYTDWGGSWHQSGGSGANLMKQEEEFLRKTWDFQNNGKRCSEILPAGNYEYPFDMILPGSTSESVEGLADTWIVYRMKATINRPMFAHNPVARRQVRIIRTLDTAALEFAHAMVKLFAGNLRAFANLDQSIENVWPDKVDYSLSTPSKAVIFGTKVQVDFRLIPLLKGLRFGKVTIELIERQEVSLKTKNAPVKSRHTNRSITKDEYRFPNDAESIDIEGQDGFTFSRALSIPQSLKNCLQTVDARGIKIRHNLIFNIQMHNPDGHISELHATLPLYVFISPNMPIDDNNNLINRGRHSVTAATAMDELTPPQYGEHQFDQLYSDIDPTGYLTPAGGPSGMSTPFQTRSRSVSSDNLASLDGVASSGLAANILQTRLSSLDMGGSNQYARDRRLDRSQLLSLGDGQGENGTDDSGTLLPDSLSRGGYFGHPGGGGVGSPRSRNHNGSDSVSRRESEENDAASDPATPQHIEYSAESLAKVPSYTTALQTQTRTPVNDGLPTYQSVTAPQLPRQAHVQRPGNNHRDILRRCS